MFGQLRSYNTRFLLPRRMDVNAVEDKRAPKYFHHQQLLVGESRSAVVAQICELGGIPVSVKQIRARPKVFKGMDREYRQMFLKAVYFNSLAMSASKALEAVIEGETSSVRAILNPALMIIKRGGTFVEAVESIGVFDESTLAILEAGERMGTMNVAINTAVQHVAASAVTSKAIMGIAGLASVEIIVALSSLLGNRYGLLPKLVENIPQGAQPAVVEEIKRAVANGILFNDIMIWATIVTFVAGFMAAYAYFDGDKNFRRWIDKKVMLIPAVGRLVTHTAVANSFKIAAALIEGGVHLPQAMLIAVKSSRVPRVVEYWEQAIKQLESGNSVANALSQPLLDNSDRVLIKAHNEAKDLASSFRNIAEKRLYLAGKATKQCARLLFVCMTLYTVLAVGSSLYVMYIQNSALLSEMKS